MPTKRSLYPIPVLLLICLAIGGYKMAAFHCISRDSVVFLNFARDLVSSPDQAIRSYDQHPGYPAMILASQGALNRLQGPLTLGGRIAAAQAVTLLCRSLALCLLYLFFLHFSRPGPAFLNTLILLLIPAYADNGSDVLSDWPALLLMALAGWLCLVGIKRWHPGFFLAAGIASGLGYYIRPEAIVFLPVLLVFAALRGPGNPECRRRMVASLALMSCAAACVMIPYVLYKGALFPKKNIGRFSDPPVARSAQLAPAENRAPCGMPSATTGILSSVPKGIFHLFEEAANILFLFLLAWGLALIYKLLHFRRLSDPDRFLALFAAGWFLLMIWLYGRAGYISHRHLLPLIAFTFAWLYEGIVGTIRFLVRHPGRVQTGVLIFLAVGTAIFVPKLLRPVRSDKAVYREAGQWLNRHTGPRDRLCVFDPRIGFYAQRSWSPLMPRFFSRCSYLVAEPGGRPDGLAAPQTTLLKTGIERVDARIAIYRLPNPSPP